MSRTNVGLANPYLRTPPRRSFLRPSTVDQIGSMAFTVPYLIAFALFAAFPLGFGIYVSVHSWNAITGAGPFVGLKNYGQLFSMNNLAGSAFLTGLLNTLLFVVISVPFLVAVPAAFSYLIYVGPWKNVFRFVFFFPSVLSVTAVTTVWTWILSTQGGLLSGLLGIQIPWLTEQPWAWISIVGTTVWWSLGFNLIILYAGLTQIPTSVFEAAKIDGASPVRLYFSIVVPQLRNILAVITVLSTIASFNVFAQSYLMTSGGPGTSTESLTMFIYNQAFNQMQMGSATAMAFFMGIIIMVFSFVQYRFARYRG